MVNRTFIERVAKLRLTSLRSSHKSSSREDERVARELQARWEQEDIKDEQTFECGCCFVSYEFHDMAQCKEAHLFCKNCVKKYAQQQISVRKTVLNCMATDGCTSSFPDTELARVLTHREMELLQWIRQEKELREARFDNLESCPFCPFAMIIETRSIKVFQCMNEACMKESCRRCKRAAHPDKTCDENEQNTEHKIHEAMSNALVRICPNERCNSRFFKEEGCNKMTCPSCGTRSCYLCGQTVQNYNHFIRDYGPAGDAKCRLWDDTKALDELRVEEARIEATRTHGYKVRARRNAQPDIIAHALAF